MLLVVDIGNTTTRLAVWEQGQVGRPAVSATGELNTAERVGAFVESGARGAAGDVEVALCSGVPAAEEVWREWGAERIFAVRGDTPSPLTNRYAEPARLGGDRLAAAVAAAHRFGAPVVVASLGTATVVDAISSAHEFLGGAIAIGVQAGLDALAEKAAALPRVDARVEAPVEAGESADSVGDNTAACLLSGAVQGTAALVEGLAQRMRETVGAEAPLAITGGNAALVSSYLKVEHEVAPTLTLEGAALVWEHNRGNSP